MTCIAHTHDTQLRASSPVRCYQENPRSRAIPACQLQGIHDLYAYDNQNIKLADWMIVTAAVAWLFTMLVSLHTGQPRVCVEMEGMKPGWCWLSKVRHVMPARVRADPPPAQPEAVVSHCVRLHRRVLHHCPWSLHPRWCAVCCLTLQLSSMHQLLRGQQGLSLPVLHQAHPHHLIMWQSSEPWCSAGMHWDLYTANNNVQSPYLGAGVPRLYNVDGETPASATVTDLPAQQIYKPVLNDISDSQDCCGSRAMALFARL